MFLVTGEMCLTLAMHTVHPTDADISEVSPLISVADVEWEARMRERIRSECC